MTRRTRVGIIGAGPAGLVLANVLRRSGIDCVVVERRTRERVQERARAGFIEQRTVDYLREQGLSTRLDAEAMRHVRCEFRVDGERISVPYGELAGGRAHHVYPQQLLVRDLVDALVAEDEPPLFCHEVVAISGIDGDRPLLSCRREDDHGSASLQIACDFVAGCDGFHGIARRAPSPGAAREYARRYPFDWLSVLAEVPPALPEVVYALHDDGFAGWMPRTTTVSRFYLQVARGDAVASWPDERIWRELGDRLAADGCAALTPGPVIEKGTLTMRSALVDPMRHGRLFLAGDAAHILTPSGAKGMNLAIADAGALASALIDHYERDDEQRLRTYSRTRLDDVWRAQEFSDWLLALVHAPQTGTADAQFTQQLRLARLAQLRGSSPQAVAFSHRYVG